MCLNPISLPVKVCGRVVDWNVVPCGKCPECIDKRQKDMMQVFLNVSQRSRCIVFATFTYDDDHLPHRYNVWDYESGSVVASSFDRSELEPDDCQDIIQAPSLRRRDWRLWLKAARVSYERTHGEKLPAFTYATIGEYGKLHQRPHYHTLFYDLPYPLAEELCRSWDKGFHYCQIVDPSQHLSSVCRYMAKYLYKGFYEIDDVLNDLAERPRVMASKGLLRIDDSFRSWLIGEDLGISLQTVFLSDEMARRLLDRRRLLIDGFSYSLGKHYVDRVFRHTVIEDGKRKVVPYPLQVALSAFIRKCNDTVFDKQFRSLEVSEGSEVAFRLVLDEARQSEVVKVSRNESICETLQEYYRRSKL